MRDTLGVSEKSSGRARLPSHTHRRVLLPELLRWIAGEFMAGRGGRFHLTFHSFLANRVLQGRLKPARLQAALRYILVASVEANDTECLDILAYCHASSLPLAHVSNETLAALHAYAVKQPYTNHDEICKAVHRELAIRATIEESEGLPLVSSNADIKVAMPPNPPLERTRDG